ncbi:branched-chain amino acid aminotransferase [Coniella lustricola]|uniref:Branched-chain amino acid aminotransferase n=1 Tax=Coniella lustricola TaxID=2025994 RepID=A0A2T3AFT7_9PEZI|nr:branched-chain amino acid aminotransferase [Coniella lustricola]
MAPGAISLPPSANGTDGTNGTKEIINGTNLPTKTQNGLPIPAGLDASKLIITKSPSPRAVPDAASAFATEDTICTDHMITCAWDRTRGWSAPELKPFGPFSLMPTASVLHYATECFEGLKVYRGFDGRLRLFRPDCNTRRFLRSAARVSLPAFDPDELEKLLVALVAFDGPKWLPRDEPGAFLYLRPALIGTQSTLGVCTPTKALLFVTLSYMKKMDSPGGLKLCTSPEDTVRAWAGGFGHAKLGANYGPSLVAAQAARDKGYDQILWLYGPEGYCTEAGASNFMVVWTDKESGKTQIVTAPLDDSIILDGITRRSLLQLARDRLGDEVEVVEKKYTMNEVIEAQREGRLRETFAVGTAYFVTPVSVVHHRGIDIHIDIGDGYGGKYALLFTQWLKDIMYGGEDHPWGLVVPEEA